MVNWLPMALFTWMFMMSSICASSMTKELEYSDWYLLKLSPEEGNTTKEILEEPAINISSALLNSLSLIHI